MIVTQRKRVPWVWVFLMALPYFSNSLVEGVSGSALTFTMKKFISNPALITFLGSINVLFNFMVGPFVSYTSDRNWTRFGRRKPFIITGWIGLILSLIVTPLAPNIWLLAVAIVFYQFFQDFAFSGPYDPLYYETVPLPQRGRGQALVVLMNNCAGLFFNYVLIGHFDEVYNLRLNLGVLHVPVALTGEQMIYLVAASVVTFMVFHIGWNVKETPVQSSVIGERFSMRRFLKGVFGERQWIVIYILIFSQVAMNQGLNQLGPLLITEQFGYSKQALGELGAITTLLRIVVLIPIAGYFADKIDRVRMFQTVLILSTLHHIIYWGFVHFIAPKPTFWAIVAFDCLGSFVSVAGNIAVGPLFFDFVPRDRMGTVYAGMSFVRGLVKITVMNGVGIWITWYAKMFLPAGQYDYMSGFLYTFLLGCIGCAASFYFISQRKKGRIIEYGRLDQERPTPGPDAT
ncbi:MAG: MFS transporter [Candidatus Sumerlaeota bacterium]|nr:MFS transporter [Candidatus Sumerlaeota bacterium]